MTDKERDRLLDAPQTTNDSNHRPIVDQETSGTDNIPSSRAAKKLDIDGIYRHIGRSWAQYICWTVSK